MLNIYLFSVILGTIQALVLNFNLTVPQMDPAYVIPVSNFGSLINHNRNCSMILDSHITIYCANSDTQEYIIEFGTIDQLFNAENKKQDTDSPIISSEYEITLVSQIGNHINFYVDKSKRFTSIYFKQNELGLYDYFLLALYSTINPNTSS